MASPKWDRARAEALRLSMSDADIFALRERSETDLGSLTLDEVGVLFLVTLERIRVIEGKQKR
jgi:DNA-directed RNA polymerase sigma subunit (sigma70/sigma32)